MPFDSAHCEVGCFYLNPTLLYIKHAIKHIKIGLKLNNVITLKFFSLVFAV